MVLYTSNIKLPQPAMLVNGQLNRSLILRRLVSLSVGVFVVDDTGHSIFAKVNGPPKQSYSRNLCIHRHFNCSSQSYPPIRLQVMVTRVSNPASLLEELFTESHSCLEQETSAASGV